VLSTVPTTDTHTALCCLTPTAPRTARRGELSSAPVASESVYRTNCSLRASAIHFRVSVASAFAPAEPPMMVRPRHRLGLGSLCCQHTANGTSFVMPCVRLSLELPRRTGSGVAGALLQCIKDRTAPPTMLP
jgi:hypothetical protein